MNPRPVEPVPASRLFGGCRLRRSLVCLAALAALVGAFYAEEDWRGRRDWNQYRQATEARGESLDLRFYIPKPVPDDQNFCATPFLKAFFQTKLRGLILTNDLWSRANARIPATYSQKAREDRGHRRFTDLVGWQQAFAALQNGPLKGSQEFETTNTGLAERAAAAPAVLEGMEPDAAVFAELRAASTRTYSLCPVAYDLENPWPILWQYVSGMKYLCQRLDLEACAELAAGQTDQALADVKLSIALTDSLKSEPFLISYLVRVACFPIAIQAVWEGLAEHRGTDAQLQELQVRFLSCDFLGDLDQTLKEERAAGVLWCDRIKKQGVLLDEDMWFRDSTSAAPRRKDVFKWFGWLIPAGWYDQEKLNYCRQLEEPSEGVVDFGAKNVSPHNSPSDAAASLDQLRSSVLKATLHHRLIAARLLYLGPVLAKAAITQTIANQAALACALERYRLANGQFPETLEALAPQFISRLPNDVIGGQPYKYRRTGDGQFVLYSVGWNEKDDGGVPGTTLFDQTQGDWVWDYPE
ncbi:MAG: hypothetical protein ABSF38_05325 [Verrucomicrobiota bacterium]